MFASEEKVEKFLKSLGIRCEYERPVYLEDGGRPRVWTPDFYLPELGVYVEVWGSNRELAPVKKNYEYRKKVYEENEIPIVLIDAYKDDEFSWKRYFIGKINEIHKLRYSRMKEIKKKFNAPEKGERIRLYQHDKPIQTLPQNSKPR